MEGQKQKTDTAQELRTKWARWGFGCTTGLALLDTPESIMMIGNEVWVKVGSDGLDIRMFSTSGKMVQSYWTYFGKFLIQWAIEDERG